MTNHDWTITVGHAGYLPDAIYELHDFPLNEALAALWGEIEHTADTYDLEPPAQLDLADSTGASCQFAGYEHELHRLPL